MWLFHWSIYKNEGSDPVGGALTCFENKCGRMLVRIRIVYVNLAKVAVTLLCALMLETPSHSQQPSQAVTPERAAANAFERAMQAEGGRNLKRIDKKHLRDFCAADARHWGDGVKGYERITFANEEELASRMLALVHQWKTTGSQNVPVFDPSDFPKLRRYAVADCGVVGNKSKVAVAVYLPEWDTYWTNWANLLGK
jgi:hypothetical protein